MKNKQQLIAEIKENLENPTILRDFEHAEEFIDNSEDEQFIIVVTKQTIKQLSKENVKLIEIN